MQPHPVRQAQPRPQFVQPQAQPSHLAGVPDFRFTDMRTLTRTSRSSSRRFTRSTTHHSDTLRMKLRRSWTPLVGAIAFLFATRAAHGQLSVNETRDPHQKQDSDFAKAYAQERVRLRRAVDQG